jgi:elongation factor P--beta-lysine ligase
MNPNHCVPLLEITWAAGRVQQMLESAPMVEWLIDALHQLTSCSRNAALPTDRYLELARSMARIWLVFDAGSQYS